MTLRESAQLIKQTGRIPAALGRWYQAPTTRFSLLQWAVVTTVGVAIGAYLAIISFLPPPPSWVKEWLDFSSSTWHLFYVLVVFAPFMAIIAAQIVGNLQRLLLAVILLEIPIQMDYRFGFSEFEQRFGATSGFTVSLTTFCLVILYAWWLADLLSKRTLPLPRSFFRMRLPAITYMVIVILSILVARNITLAINEIDLLLQSFLLYIYISHTVRTRQDVVFIVTVLLIGLIFNSVLILGMSAAGVGGGTDKVVVQRATDYTRAAGTLSAPNLAGSYLAMILVIIYTILAAPLTFWHKLLTTLAIGMGGVALLFTGSRGAWGSFAACAALLTFLLWRPGWLSLKVPIFYFILAMSLALIFYEPLLERLFGESADIAAASRGPLNVLAIRMIEDYPLFGVGANNFSQNMRPYITPEFHNLWITTVHNQYLLVWAETGIVGLGAYLWFLLATLRQGWQIWKCNDRFLSPLALGFFAAIVAAMIHMTGEKYHARVQIDMVWLTAGIIAAMYNNIYKQKAVGDE